MRDIPTMIHLDEKMMKGKFTENYEKKHCFHFENYTCNSQTNNLNRQHSRRTWRFSITSAARRSRFSIQTVLTQLIHFFLGLSPSVHMSRHTVRRFSIHNGVHTIVNLFLSRSPGSPELLVFPLFLGVLIGSCVALFRCLGLWVLAIYAVLECFFYLYQRARLHLLGTMVALAFPAHTSFLQPDPCTLGLLSLLSLTKYFTPPLFHTMLCPAPAEDSVMGPIFNVVRDPFAHGVEAFERFLHYFSDPRVDFCIKKFLSGWCGGAPAESIGREDLKDLVAYGFFYVTRKEFETRWGAAVLEGARTLAVLHRSVTCARRMVMMMLLCV